MEYVNYMLLVLVMFFIIRRILGVKGIKNITTAELKNQLNDVNKQYIDVRTPAEYKANNIQGFKNIPLQQLPKKLNELSKDKEVIIICQSGMRSNKASTILKKNGFTQVTNVRGGMSTWS
ncbi:rhodanese-like domain-containing protein [Bacillaceae bacterium CLA-AA-H227]|uniref:Rhodanese-like domain-containing protein n=2 Tax=Robertmurraya TaxID=2837507 RepID=A0A4U1D086_9BACI|nr:rhodanese-like domain-containing protein [Robertmurraya kyonggiensis]TKC15128.1 rhodanese-like domain-containing protein [Robertmurraya kyonggiensis]